jgi:hypothetical protein
VVFGTQGCTNPGLQFANAVGVKDKTSETPKALKTRFGNAVGVEDKASKTPQALTNSSPGLESATTLGLRDVKYQR